jgi:hypothetical protein
MVTRIPLDTIERAFFSDLTEEFTGITSPDFDPTFPETVEMNDYTVIRLGDKPIPKREGPRPYPRYPFDPIHPNVPSTFYAVKTPASPPPEYVPPSPPKPRAVDELLLSQSQKEMYGKAPFDQDLVVIAKRKAMLAAARAPLPSDPRIPKVRGSKIFKREYAEHHKVVEEKKKLERVEADREAKREARERAKYEREKKELKEIIARRDAERAVVMQNELADREDLRRRRVREIAESPIAGRVSSPTPTRASRLKDESCRRMLEHRSIENRRENLNDELQREREAGHTKKLQEVFLRLGPIGGWKKRSDKARMEMKAAARSWKRRMLLLDKTLDLGMTLLERVSEPAGPIESADLTQISPDAIIAT